MHSMNFSGIKKNSFSQGSLPRINMGAYPDIAPFGQHQLLFHGKLRLLNKGSRDIFSSGRKLLKLYQNFLIFSIDFNL